MKRWLLLLGLILCCQPLAGCWDRVELEDQLFVTAVALDVGSTRRYRVTFRVPVAGSIKAGVLGAEAKSPPGGEVISAEADSVAQAMIKLNASVARRITLRHMRAMVVGESLARAGLSELFAEMLRNGEVRPTVAFIVARGTAAGVIKAARYTGETNPAKLSEGMLIVEKYLHLSPPIRMHHMINRSAGVGLDPFAPVIAINPRITNEGDEGEVEETALAGGLQRYDGNPVETAGTAVFRKDRLVGYLTVDETQALLALRGEMGKAYVTIPKPGQSERRVLMRFQQENKPSTRVLLTQQGARATVRLVFEGEVLSGEENYGDIGTRKRFEKAAADYMTRQMNEVLKKVISWEADPIGYGLRVRRQFPTWDAWKAYRWHERVGELKVSATAEMRLRRFGLTMGTEQTKQIK